MVALRLQEQCVDVHLYTYKKTKHRDHIYIYTFREVNVNFDQFPACIWLSTSAVSFS